MAKIRRNIRLKQKMLKDFKCSVNPHESLKDRTLGMEHNNYIIHSIDDVYYPEFSSIAELGISSWFKVEPYDFYFNGIEVLLRIVHLLVTDDGWRPLTLDEISKAENFNSFPKAYMVGRIPYEAIIDYDLDGDEYYMFPHIYCDFKFNSEPYEEIAYYYCPDRNSNNPYPFRFNPKERLKSS